jgi:prevent-host-death family protein
MISVGVRDLKANLSHYLRVIREQRTDVAITAHGKTIARLTTASVEKPSAHDVLERMMAQGLLELPSQPRKAGAVAIKRCGKGMTASEMIVEDRR